MRGFYDGDGVFAVRFSPNTEGEWRYTIAGDLDAFERSGSLVVIPAPSGEHGPVRADGRFLRHADGTLHLSLGTTCHAWAHQSHAMREATLATLRSKAGRAVNKIRMTIFPKWYPYNKHNPALFPFRCLKQEGCSPPRAAPMAGTFVPLTRPFGDETLVARLREEGIIADLILFHPYDGGQWALIGRTCSRNLFHKRMMPTTCGTRWQGLPPSPMSGGRWRTNSIWSIASGRASARKKPDGAGALSQKPHPWGPALCGASGGGPLSA